MSIAVEESINGKTILWTAPTFDQVRIGWDETRHACADKAKFIQQTMTAHMPNNGKIIYRSLDDPDNARGHTADGIIIDEAGDAKERAWYEVLSPMLIDTGGWFWAIGTPRGRNYFWREWVDAVNREDSMSWQIPTLGVEIVGEELIRKPHPLENPDVPFEEILNRFKTTPRNIFRQEYLAEFLEGEGAVFRNIQACMNAVQSFPEAHKGHRVVCGVDWAKQADFTAISIGCADCHYELVIDRFNKIDFAFQRERLKALCDKWHVKQILAERNSIGEPNIEELVRAGLSVTGFDTTASSKPPLIENLALALEKAEWKFINDKIWAGELESYEQKINATTGRSTYGAPEGMHDDTVIARALMLRVATSRVGVLFEV